MQSYQLLHIFHLFVVGHVQPSEDAAHYPYAHCVVSVESPSHNRVEALGGGLGHVVQQSRPLEPQVGLLAGHRYVVHHFQGVQEVVLVPLAIDELHALQGTDLWQEPL